MGLIAFPLDSSYEKTGAQAVRSIIRASRTDQLSGMGSIALDVANSEEARDALGVLKRVSVHSDHSGDVEEVLIGRMRGKTQQINAETTRYTGDDQLHELRDVLIDQVVLSQDAQYTPVRFGVGKYNAANDEITEWEWADSFPFTYAFDGDCLIYCGHDTRWYDLDVTLSWVAGSGNCYLSWDHSLQTHIYSDGTSATGWFDTASATDGTRNPADNTTLSQSGVFGSDIDERWIVGRVTEQSLFWRRLRIQGTRTVTFHDVTITAEGPDPNDVSTLMGSAPAGWSLSGSYASGTEDGTYYDLRDMTFLAALNTIADQSGESWRANGRVIEWLGYDSPDSGVLALASGVSDAGLLSNDAVALITSAEIVRDASEFVTRYRVRGGGSGDAVLTLAAATWNAPTADYFVDKNNSTVYAIAAESETGEVIEQPLTLSDIVNDETTTEEAAANELARAAYARLVQQAVIPTQVRLSLVHLRKDVRPGDRIYVRYAKPDSLGNLIEIDEYLYVIEISAEYTSTVTWTVLCSSTRRRPMTNDEIAADRIIRDERAQRRNQAMAATAVVGRYVQEA